MINFADIEKWLRTLPADKELVEATLDAWDTAPVQRVITALGRVAEAYGGQVQTDPSTGRVVSIKPPVSTGGHPIGTDRGEI
jgi:hypothetical protein